MTVLHAFGMLLILLSVLLTLAALAGMAAAWASHRPRASGAVLAALAGWYVLLLAFVAAVSFAEPGRSLGPGQVKRFCGFYLDCHVGAAVAGRQRLESIGTTAPRGVFEVVTIEISSDARAEPMRPYGVQAALTDASGRRYLRDASGEAAWERLTGRSVSFDQEVAPRGGSFLKDVVFDVPREVSGLVLDIRERGLPDDLLEFLLAGDEDSFMHRRTLLRLPDGK